MAGSEGTGARALTSGTTSHRLLNILPFGDLIPRLRLASVAQVQRPRTRPRDAEFQARRGGTGGIHRATMQRRGCDHPVRSTNTVAVQLAIAYWKCPIGRMTIFDGILGTICRGL